jgi:hypothetical protein
LVVKTRHIKVTINVNPQIMAFAGNDTDRYRAVAKTSWLWCSLWYRIALDRNDISDPVALLSQNQTYVMKTFNRCFL